MTVCTPAHAFIPYATRKASRTNTRHLETERSNPFISNFISTCTHSRSKCDCFTHALTAVSCTRSLQLARLASSFAIKQGASLLGKMAERVSSRESGSSGAASTKNCREKDAGIDNQQAPNSCKYNQIHCSEGEGGCKHSPGSEEGQKNERAADDAPQHHQTDGGSPSASPARVHGGNCGDEDVTFVTAALDIGRRHGNVTFHDHYIGNLKHLPRLGCKVTY